jgi:enoyl-CoA hydratase/carnithine racemase
MGVDGHHEGMDLPEFKTIRVVQPDRETVVVTLARPDRLNALTATMIDELTDLVEAAQKRPPKWSDL